MKLMYLIALVFFISPLSVASEAVKPSDDIIVINVGGTVFNVSRNTLLNASDSPLARMFALDQKMAPSRLDENGHVFLDDDPNCFADILFFLRYGGIPFASIAQAERTRMVANKLCPSMVGPVDAWLKSNALPPALPHSKKKALSFSLYPLQKNAKDGDPRWYLAKAPKGIVIGSDWGSHSVNKVQNYIDEYTNRTMFKELCYAWSGHGISIYNCKKNMAIEEVVADWRTHEFLDHWSKYKKLNLIENAVRFDKKHYYVCSFNKIGTFSIFNVNTGQIMLNETFISVADCKKAILERLNPSKMDVNAPK